MSVPAAYVGVVIIWSTTPLAIQWSGDGAGFLFGVAARMVLGALIAAVLLRLARVALPWHREALLTYLAATVGIYGAMMCVYFGAQFIPSGWISVLFGLSPFFTGLLATLWLGESVFTPMRITGMVSGLAGLAIIFGNGLAMDASIALGIGAVLCSVMLQSLSAVWVKRLGARVDGLSVVVGGLLLAAPLYLLTWLLFGEGLPESLPLRTTTSILYLALFGSVVGFTMYFFLLRAIKASRVALITLMTPVLALWLGVLLNGEVLRPSVLAGTALILTGLACYEWRTLRRLLLPGARKMV
ncbi:MAG TPA: DMT family transporter [Thioalkalivibrio sp.]|nr:DMT family transporter [Thioalkalivibrio sp.]